MPASVAIATGDHLVVAAATLADGIDYVATLTGAEPQQGGRHAAMGTHNALLRLGNRLYLEVIAIDPAAPPPAQPRWFGLDDSVRRRELVERPRLVHWVARTDDLELAIEAAQTPLGLVRPMSRGMYRWRITAAADGRPPAGGILPALIEWGAPAHPADFLPACDVTLADFAASHAEPGPLRATLARIGLAGTLHVSYDRSTRLAAMLRTRRGIVTISS